MSIFPGELFGIAMEGYGHEAVVAACKDAARQGVVHWQDVSSNAHAFLGCNAGQLWPRLDSALSHMASEMLRPLFQENKPSWMHSVKLERCGHHQIVINW